MLDVFLEPFQLVSPQRPKSVGLKVHEVHEADEVHAFLVEAVPACTLRVLAKTLEIALTVVVDIVVFARNVEDVLAGEHLPDGVELLWPRKMSDVAGVNQELGVGGQCVNSVQCNL